MDLATETAYFASIGLKHQKISRIPPFKVCTEA